MKYFYLCFIFAPMLLSGLTYAQKTCCDMTANAKFISFMADDEFIRTHAAPLPYKAEALAGSMVTFPTSSGATTSVYLVSSKKHPNKVLFMFHDFWGLNDYNKTEADSLSNELGVTVCEFDLFDGKVPTTREEASKLAQSLSAERANAMIDAAIAHFGANTHFGTIGWCMGGTWSQQAALRASKQCTACVIYYGMPELDLERLKILSAPVLGIFGNKDQWITPKVVSDYQQAMKTAGKHLNLKTYDAGHAFANPSDPNNDKAAAADAHKYAIDFLKRKMQLF